MNSYKNLIAFCIDESGSMSHLREQVVKVFNNQIKYLAGRSNSTLSHFRLKNNQNN